MVDKKIHIYDGLIHHPLVKLTDYEKLEAENRKLLSAWEKRYEENQKLREIIKRALEYRLEDVMRKSDVRKLEQAVGK